MPKESNKNLSGNSFAPEWIDGYKADKLKFNGNCLRQDSIFSS